MDTIQKEAKLALIEQICKTVKSSCEDLGLSDGVAYVLLHDIIVATGCVKKKSSINREPFNPYSIEDDNN